MRYFLFPVLLIFLLSSAAQAEISSFLKATDQFLQTHVKNNRVDYAAIASNPTSLDALRTTIAATSLAGLSAKERQAFYINAYNILVIGGVIDAYPTKSVLDVAGFFDAKKHPVAGKRMTLNDMEKKELLGVYQDARFHFVLVCGALGCPPIINEAYRPEKLDAQLSRQTRLALNDPQFIKVNAAENSIQLSQIFEWYASDFGGNKLSSIEFINPYRKEALPTDFKVSFYPYDWSLNILKNGRASIEEAGLPASNNASRYVVSAAVPKGGTETKIFNNIYTQVTGNNGELRDRSTFLTSNVSFLYGLNSRFNLGFDLRYRQVSYGTDLDSPFGVLSIQDGPNERSGITAFGPKIRFAPFSSLPNFSIQSSFVFATGEDLAGSAERPYIDWNGSTWFTQIFNDFSIGENFSLFTELDILLEDMGPEEENHINRFSTPVQAIFSYFPNPKTTLYTLGAYSPYWQEDFDYFYQVGFGAKYQFTPKLELEVLYTNFRNEFLLETGGRASTINLGVRFSTF